VPEVREARLVPEVLKVRQLQRYPLVQAHHVRRLVRGDRGVRLDLLPRADLAGQRVPVSLLLPAVPPARAASGTLRAGRTLLT